MVNFCWNPSRKDFRYHFVGTVPTPCAALLLQITCQASCSRHQPCTFCCVCVGGPSQWTNFNIARYRQSCGSTTRGEPRVWWTWTDMEAPSGLVECFYHQTTVNQACIHETPVYWEGSLSIPCVKWDDGVMSMEGCCGLQFFGRRISRVLPNWGTKKHIFMQKIIAGWSNLFLIW